MNTGLPRHLTVMVLPSSTPDRSTSRELMARVSAAACVYSSKHNQYIIVKWMTRVCMCVFVCSSVRQQGRPRGSSCPGSHAHIYAHTHKHTHIHAHTQHGRNTTVSTDFVHNNVSILMRVPFRLSGRMTQEVHVPSVHLLGARSTLTDKDTMPFRMTRRMAEAYKKRPPV